MVVTTESLLNDKKNIAADSYEGPSRMVVTTESLLNDKKNIAADSYRKLPKHLKVLQAAGSAEPRDLGSLVSVLSNAGTSLLKEGDWVVPLSDTMGTASFPKRLGRI